MGKTQNFQQQPKIAKKISKSREKNNSQKLRKFFNEKFRC